MKIPVINLPAMDFKKQKVEKVRPVVAEASCDNCTKIPGGDSLDACKLRDVRGKCVYHVMDFSAEQVISE